MKKRIIALLITFVLILGMIPISFIGSAEEEYTYLDLPGFESYAKKIVLAMAYRYGVKAVTSVKQQMPGSESDVAIQVTAFDAEGTLDRIEFGTCRVPNSNDGVSFADGVKTDIIAGGTSYNLFGDKTLADTDGIRIHIAKSGKDEIFIPSGKVKIQFSVTPSRGKSTAELYAEYDEGFVFESAEFQIGGDGYVYVGYAGISPIDGTTPANADFRRDYLHLVNAINVIFVPDEKISDGDIFYISDLDAYCKSGEYDIRAGENEICGNDAYVVATSDKQGTMSVLLDGKKLPAYITAKSRVNSFGKYCLDVGLDSDYIGEGYHNITLLLDGKVVHEETICLDSTAPVLKYSSIKDGAVVPSSGEISLEATDAESSVVDIAAKLDNVAITLPYSYTSLSSGVHLLSYTITDAAGNTLTDNITFTVGGVSFGELTAAEASEGYELSVSGADGGIVELYSVGKTLPITAYSNIVGLSELSEKTPYGEITSTINGSKLVSRNEKYPYIAYEVDVSEYTKETVFLSFTGAANIGETLKLSAYSEAEGNWKELSRARMTGGSLSLNAEVKVADYADDGKIKCRVSLLSVDNGSDSFAWTTDAQHAIEHNYEDGSYRDYTFYIEEQNEWLVEEYNNGNISYVVNTGDIANDNDNESQYAEAREINNILDNAGIPNGVLPGNHDMLWESNLGAWYYWQKYFGTQYYENTDWYGGSIDEKNNLHYDLVTVGGRDMIFMCASFGLDKDNQHVYDWISKTLNMYPDRTAVFCTHSYLGVENDLTTDGGIEWWKNVIQKCPTICLVLCGHEPGSANNIRVTDDGRKVTELLHDYQSDWYPNWWNWGEGGWGLFRYVTFGDGTVSNRTYTASKEHYDKDYYWDYELENFTMPMEFIENNRVIEGHNFAALESSEGTKVATAKVAGGKVIFDTELEDEIYYAACGELTSGILSVASGNDAPVLTNVKGYGGRLRLNWEAASEAEGYAIYINGSEYTTVAADCTSYVSEVEYACGDNCVVTVAAISADGTKRSSQIVEVVFVGLGKFTYGDVDNSGETDVADALAALRMSIDIAENVTPEEWFASDVDVDGEITVSDALSILRTAAGLKN